MSVTELTALESRRDDLFALCCDHGTPADWAEYERCCAALQAELLGDRLYPPLAIDRAALEAWYAGMDREYDVTDDVPY